MRTKADICSWPSEKAAISWLDVHMLCVVHKVAGGSGRYYIYMYIQI